MVRMAETLTTAEAAERLGVKPSWVRRLILAGRLPATKHGRDWLLRVEDVDALPREKAGWPLGKARGPKKKANDD